MIADVALHLPLRRTFDYIVEEPLAPQVEPGCRVIVPFGSRLTSGIVVALKETSDLDASRLRAVHQVGEGGVLFSAELLDFTRWVAGYYFCGWGEVLAAAIPPGMAARIQTRFRLRPGAEADQAAAKLPPAAREFLAAHGEWSEAQWRQAGAGADEVRWLARQRAPGGAVEAVHHYAGSRGKPVVEKWLRLAPRAEGADGPAAPRAGSRKDVVLHLLRTEGEVAMARIKHHISGPSAVVKALQAEGWLEVEEKAGASRFRKSAAPAPFLALNPEQQAALDRIGAGMEAGGYHAFLLEGVTGSGKTEVYLHAVRAALAAGKSALVLVPEIALTEDMVLRFRGRFGEQVAVLHSGMNEGERFDEWRRAREGAARIVIGARSAVFAPLAALGLVVVDEEHDGSYKQDEAPRYHGRDAAMMRAFRAGAVMVLGSATPSLEALHNVSQGKLERLELPRRIEDRPMPEVEVLDLKREKRQKGSPLFTLRLVEALREVLLREEQAILFLNRRGFAHLVRCVNCEEAVVCDHCSITLTLHRGAGRLRCHRCDFSRPMPELCPACGQAGLEVVGLGTERIEEELRMMFPSARVLRMDSDTLRRRGELERMLGAIRRHEYDIIIGTQVLSKGHDFPRITLVGAVLADVSLNLPDFRAPERTFQILTQMAGRAGRGDLPGQVLIQTYSAGHFSLTSVGGHDIAGFAARELAIRQSAGIPPFSHQALVWVTGPDARATETSAVELARRLRAVGGGVQVLGAAEGPIRKINNRYRWMVTLLAPAPAPLHRLLHRVLDDPDLRIGARERIAVDVDPHHLL